MQNKVTIILPIYNVEKYLEECLNSILQQTLNDYEVVAINDGSTDKSLEILLSYKDKFQRIKIINQENSGLSASRNIGINNAEGDYILFLDSDDMLRKDAIETLYKLANENNLDLVVYDGFRIDEINNKEDKKKYCREKIFKNNVLNKDEYFKGTIKKGMLHSQFHFYKREFLNKNNLRFREGLLHEDELFSMTSYEYLNTVGYCNKQLYIRRYRSDSIMSTHIYENIKSLKSYEYILWQFSEIKNNNLENKQLVKLINSRGSLIMTNLIRYKNIKIKDILQYKKLYGFSIKYFRLIANYILYKFR
ncbi:glycosyltransferase [Clostridium carnis]